MESLEEINSPSSDFTIKYFAVGHIQSIAETDPEIIMDDTIDVLHTLLANRQYAQERKGFFIFRLAAETLKSIIIHSHGTSSFNRAYNTLINVLRNRSGYAHRVAAEALGSLQVHIITPKTKDFHLDKIPTLEWPLLLKETGLNNPPSFTFHGRSLVLESISKKEIIVVKFAHQNKDPDLLLNEAFWMEQMQSIKKDFPLRFDIPRPLKFRKSYLFRLRGYPTEASVNRRLHKEEYAICFLAHADYFQYPNHHFKSNSLSPEEFLEIVSRNAQLMGTLASMGIIHTAPIPLFHNRVERQRRRDHGLYEWFRAGRLDRWLDSCTYPNIGLTGIRDFEHFIAFNGPSQYLYRHIGTHLLSLLLISGSYFRNKDMDRVGFDNEGKPYDTRDLFDKFFLKKIVCSIFQSYYMGFVGEQYKSDLPIDLDRLIHRMINEMGVDNHMEEVLRVVDQNEMEDETFKAFLLTRGFSLKNINGFKKGSQDIIINSGPHLGEFNNRISIPELIEAVGSMSAICISGRYFMEKKQKNRKGLSYDK